MLQQLPITLIFTLLKLALSWSTTLPPISHNFKEYLPLSSSNSLYFNPTSPLEIKRIIADLKSKNSSGMDGISSKALKYTPDNILWVIAHIFNLSLSNGEFINAFKLVKVVPVFKKGSTYDVNNYRPISLLPVLSKILGNWGINVSLVS